MLGTSVRTLVQKNGDKRCYRSEFLFSISPQALRLSSCMPWTSRPRGAAGGGRPKARYICCRSSAGGPAHSSPNGCFATRSEEHTSELQSLAYLVCRLLLEKKKK